MVFREKEYNTASDIEYIHLFPNVAFLDTLDFLEGRDLSVMSGTTQEEIDNIAFSWISWAYDANKGKQIAEAAVHERKLPYDLFAIRAYNSLIRWVEICDLECKEEIPMSIIRFFASKMSENAQKDCENLITIAGECPKGIDDEKISRDFIFGIGKVTGYAD